MNKMAFYIPTNGRHSQIHIHCPKNGSNLCDKATSLMIVIFQLNCFLLRSWNSLFVSVYCENTKLLLTMKLTILKKRAANIKQYQSSRKSDTCLQPRLCDESLH